jgi:hypothetical protein
MQIDKSRRGSNGTIDIATYRREALVLNSAKTATAIYAWKREAKIRDVSHRHNTLTGKIRIAVAQQVTRVFEIFLKRIVAFVEDTHEKRSIIARYSGYRWCDSTERALSNELMGRHSWFNSK